MAWEAILAGSIQSSEDGSVDVGGGRRSVIVAARLVRDDGQVHVPVGADQGEGDGLGRPRGAVFCGEQELLPVSHADVA